MTVLRTWAALAVAVLLTIGTAVTLASSAAAATLPSAFTFDHVHDGVVRHGESAVVDDASATRFAVTDGAADHVTLVAQDQNAYLSITLTAPQGSTLATGTVSTTSTADPNATVAQVVFRDQECTNTGTVVVQDLTHDTSATYWSALSLDYRLTCDDNSVETGSVRYHDDRGYSARSVPPGDGGFGARYDGTTHTETITLINQGTTDLDPQATLTDSASGLYSVQSDGCSGTSLLAGASCAVAVSVHVTSPSVYGILTFATGGGLAPMSVAMFTQNIPHAVIHAVPSAGQIELTWSETEHYSTLDHYRLLRGTSPTTLRLLADHLSSAFYIDPYVPGVQYYSVQAVADDGRIGPATTPLAAASWPRGGAGAYQPVSPTRFLDTRNGTGVRRGAVTGGHTINVGVAGIPRDAHGNPAGESVIINLTAVGPTRRTFLTVFPYGARRPSASSLNVDAGENRANSVTVRLGTARRIAVYVDKGKVDVVADLVGYYLSDKATPSLGIVGGLYHAEPSPVRILDTRRFKNGALPGGYYEVLPLDGYSTNTQAHLRAVAVTITAVGAQASGYLTVWDPDLTGLPRTSTLNFRNGSAVANLAVVQTYSVGSVPKIAIFNGSRKPVHFLVDLVGLYDDDSLQYGARFVPTNPTRIVDSRAHLGLAHALGPHQTGTVTPPASLANYWTVALDLNLTAALPTAQTFQTVWANDLARPGVSNLNEVRGQNAANQVFTVTGTTANRFNVYNSAGTTGIVADLAGRFDLYPYVMNAQAQQRSAAVAHHFGVSATGSRTSAVVRRPAGA